MPIASTKLIVPNGLRQAEVEDWFHSSNNVRESIDSSVERSTALSRRRFLKSSAAAGLILPTSVATFVPNRVDAFSLVGLVDAIIKAFSILVPAISALQEALKPGDRIPATEELLPVDGSDLKGTNLFIVVDEETLRVETAAAATKLEKPVTYFLNGLDLNSEKLEGLYRTPLKPKDFKSGKVIVDVSKLSISASQPGYKLLTGLTSPSETSVSFKAEK